MGANSRFCLPMRRTLYQSRSNPLQPSPLQEDFTECFALANVGFVLVSYPTSQPQWIHLSLSTILGEGWLCLSGSWTYLHTATYAVGKYSFTCCLGMGLAKASRGRAAFQRGYPGRDNALKELKSALLPWFGGGNRAGLEHLSCHACSCPSQPLLISRVVPDVCPDK